MTGRKELTDWPEVIKEHQRRGGQAAAEALAKEYAAAREA